MVQAVAKNRRVPLAWKKLNQYISLHWNNFIRQQNGLIMEMYDRVCRVMRIPQIMGWWGIVLIQQTNATEAELPFWRRGKSYFLSLDSRLRYNGSRGRCVGPVVFFFFFFLQGEWETSQFWGFWTKIPVSVNRRQNEKCLEVIITGIFIAFALFQQKSMPVWLMCFSNLISTTFLPCLASLFTNNSQQMPGESFHQIFSHSDVLEHVVFLWRAAFLGMCTDSLIVLFPVISGALCLSVATR